MSDQSAAGGGKADPLVPEEPAHHTTDFPDDDEVYRILDEAYALAEAAYPANEGQGYFENLLVRATIGLCRRVPGTKRKLEPIREIVRRKVARCPNMSAERIWEDLRAENPDRWLQWSYVCKLIKELRHPLVSKAKS